MFSKTIIKNIKKRQYCQPSKTSLEYNFIVFLELIYV
jgi:hypothetical protein